MQDAPIQRLIGWALAGGGSLVALVQDQFAGLTVSGVIAAGIAISGAVILIRNNWKESARKQRIADAETQAAEDKIRQGTLSGQIAALTHRLEEEAREAKERETHATLIQSSLKESLDLARENYAAVHADLERLRASNHEIRNKLNPISLERDELKIKLDGASRHIKALEAKIAEIVATTSRTEKTTDRIESTVSHMATGSQDNIPTDLAPRQGPTA